MHRGSGRVEQGAFCCRIKLGPLSLAGSGARAVPVYGTICKSTEKNTEPAAAASYHADPKVTNRVVENIDLRGPSHMHRGSGRVEQAAFCCRIKLGLLSMAAPGARAVPPS